MIQIEQNIWPITSEDARMLWEDVCRITKMNSNEPINVRLVKEAEMAELNGRYRGKDRATNVLTFSYGSDTDWPIPDREDMYHEILICAEVGIREAKERQADWRDYMALLLVHALLHAAGYDHERSEKEAKITHQLERKVLQGQGFRLVSW